MSYSVHDYECVLLVRNIKVQYVFGRLARLACEKRCIYNLLYDANTGAPFAAIYTNDPEELAKIIREEEKLTYNMQIVIMRNRHFQPPTIVNDDDDMDGSPF